MASTVTGTANFHWSRTGAVVQLSAAGDAILNSVGQAARYSVISIDPNGATRVLTSTPTIPSGNFNGKDIEIINQDTTYTVVIQDAQFLAGTKLSLGYPQIPISPGRSVRLVYAGILDRWVLTSNVLDSEPNTVSAFSGGGQASATVISFPVSNVSTVTSAGDSVKMKAIGSGTKIGALYRLFNTTSNAFDLYPETGGAIDGLAANTPISVASNTGVILTAVSSGVWRTS